MADASVSQVGDTLQTAWIVRWQPGIDDEQQLRAWETQLAADLQLSGWVGHRQIGGEVPVCAHSDAAASCRCPNLADLTSCASECNGYGDPDSLRVCAMVREKQIEGTVGLGVMDQESQRSNLAAGFKPRHPRLVSIIMRQVTK